MIKFLSVPGELLHNPDLNSAHKLLLSYLLNLNNNERYFYGSEDYLCVQFGCPLSAIQTCIRDLIKMDMISKDSTGALRLTVTAQELYSYRKPSYRETELSSNFQERASNIARVLSINKKVG